MLFNIIEIIQYVRDQIFQISEQALMNNAAL